MDTQDLFEHITRTLATRPYFPCILLVHPAIERLQQVEERLAAHSGWPVFDVGKVLVSVIAGLPNEKRSLNASVALDRPLVSLRPGPVICKDLAPLFEPSLSLDPLALLRQWSRSIPLVALWPGQYAPPTLTYAVAEHSHYRAWNRTQLSDGAILSL